MDGSRMKRPLRRKAEVRLFLDRPILDLIDRKMKEGGLGDSRSEVIRTILRDWARRVGAWEA